MSRGTFWLALSCSVILLIVVSSHAEEEAPPPLPKAMGAINDYAAVLGKESREQLQTWINELKTKSKINVVLLITLLDPYSDPPTLTQKIWEAWKLGGEPTIFLLFVREADRWAFDWKFTQDLAPRLVDLSLGGELIRSMQALLNERRVGTAAMQAVERLKATLIELETPESQPQAQEEPSLPAPANVPRSFVGSPAFWSIVGGAAGIAVIAGLIWFALTWLCPGCGGRLSRGSTRTFGPSYSLRSRRRRGERVYYCRRCGYLRVRRGER